MGLLFQNQKKTGIYRKNNFLFYNRLNYALMFNDKPFNRRYQGLISFLWEKSDNLLSHGITRYLRHLRRFDENNFNDLLTNYIWISLVTNKNNIFDALKFSSNNKFKRYNRFNFGENNFFKNKELDIKIENFLLSNLFFSQEKSFCIENKMNLY